MAGVVMDLLDPERPVIGVERVLTDGTWAWTSDVIFYVRKYHIRLPEEFVRHMQENRWEVAQVTDFSALRLW